MIVKLSYLRLSGGISLSNRLSSYVSSVSGAKCVQSNHPDDQKPLNSTEYEAKIQSLKNKPHPETLINVLSSTNDLNSSLRLFKWASLQHHFRHTTDTYHHIIMKLGLASRIDEMEGYCNEMVKSGFSASEQALLTLIDSFIMHHRFDEAFRVFSVLISNSYKPSISLINRLLGVLVEQKKGTKSVLFVYKEMVKSRICPTTDTLNYLMQALFDADQVDSMLDQYNRMQKKGCCANSQTYEIIVSGLIGKNLLNQAIIVLNEILENECDLESKFFSRVLPLLFKMNENEIGLKLFKKMKSLNTVPDLPVYEVLIQYYAKNLCLDNAIDLLNKMISLDLKLSNRVFFELVNGFCKLNKLHEAKQLLKEHQVTDADSYNVVLEGYCHCQGGSHADVMWLFLQMVEKNITNSFSWNIIISYLSENQMVDIVYKALTRMIVSGYKPNSTTYSALIIAICKSNEVNDAVDLFHHVREEQMVIDAFSFSMLIRGLCLNGKSNEVVNLMHLGSYHGLYCSAEDYNIIMKSMSTSSKSNNLLAILGRMIVQGCPLSSETYNRIIKSMSDDQRSTECVLYINRMVNEGLLPDKEILFISLSFLANKLKLHMVLPAIHKLLSVSDHGVLNHAICTVIINGLWKEGYKWEARLVLDVIFENGWVPDATTHRLLVSSGFSEDDEGDTQDEITNILSEGFGEP